MLPSVLAKQLQVALADYVQTTFPITNPVFKHAITNMVQSDDGLFRSPYVSVRLPFRVSHDDKETFQAVRQEYKPYVHQQQAFDRLTGEDGRSTIVATGTGSGKTECFLYPLLEYCYAHRGEPGIKALIIYPMNALAADQAGRIAQLIYNNPNLRGNVTAGMYVGGFDKHASRQMTDKRIVTDHETMLNSPPDILLTNYKMLDYLLVRPKDAGIWHQNNPETLKYIVVDELHTFDGAQGTDLACLLRRLKARLYTPPGYLCCVGTSATMGSDDSAENIRTYAEKVFGETFDPDAVITEDRLSPDEFFRDHDVSDHTIPTADEARALAVCAGDEDEVTYLRLAAQSWLEAPPQDAALFTDEGRVALGEQLMRHSFMRSLIRALEGSFVQPEHLITKLSSRYLSLLDMPEAPAALDALLALISHARTLDARGKIRPFLFVQVQVWMREWRRLLAKVSGDNIQFALAYDLNEQQLKHYLPVVNCRHCGETGWTTILNERNQAEISDLPTFYNLFFKRDKQVRMLYPYEEDDGRDLRKARLCPNCLSVHPESKTDVCGCGKNTIKVWLATPDATGPQNHQQFMCPFCHASGLGIMGLRSVTAISAALSQLYASHFNDDKKLLTFSDNVQDAAHRAGFFGARTWRFGLRTAIQRYALDGGANLPLDEFARTFADYWRDKLSNEQFVTTFIPPNLTWRRAYERMQNDNRFPDDAEGNRLLHDITKRLQYEVFLEYGRYSQRGRTLEKSGSSVPAINQDMLHAGLDRMLERLRNEIGELRQLEQTRLTHLVVGWIYRMKTDGAFALPVFDAYIRENANSYLLTSGHEAGQVPWLPHRRAGINTPHFLAAQRLPGKFQLPTGGSWYGHWIDKNLDFLKDRPELLVRPDLGQDVATILLEELCTAGLLVEKRTQKGVPVWALNPAALSVSIQVAHMVCQQCGTTVPVAQQDRALWQDSYCVRQGCMGIMQARDDVGLDYYGKLYGKGDMVRILPREHTGILERDDREKLEAAFKSSENERQPWYPNLLSSTPTLEMGIDIGDLSTVVLCNIPPGPSQYVQRVGRAGRKDGNSLAVAVANARPHDLYFYADPMEMISGSISPPDVFLNASAVLERQFVAYCMDCWVKTGIPHHAIPQNIRSCLSKLRSDDPNVFPFNFLNYVQTNLSGLHRRFIGMFPDELSDETKAHLRQFAQGDGLKNSPMHVRILEAFESLYDQREALLKNQRQLRSMINDLKSKPYDSSYEDELKALENERQALAGVIRSINDKNVFNFFSDEGLLPNYAFPEAGIVLRAVLYRRETAQEDKDKPRRTERTTYEYTRAASTAISELAPANSFYAEGRQLVIDQVDLSTTRSVKWRLCPNCSYAEPAETTQAVASCPHCGSVGWGDAGQVRPMLKMQLVYAAGDYDKTIIGDDSEDRNTVFYLREMLVNVDEDRDIVSAYRVGDDEFPFGYEFVQKAVMREINFGEKDLMGERLTVAGREDVRKGFIVCRHCGKIQRENRPPNHTFTCRARKQTLVEPYEECLFLYREFTTEALRILIPATTMAPTDVWEQSFVAAFMLGMRGYFGNVDHLHACTSEVPVAESNDRKQYLVIYDSVPGGTGYLKELMRSETSMIDIMETALHMMEQCNCKDDPQKDGCYHCLFAYRQSQSIGQLSRKQAMDILRRIIAGKDSIEPIPKLDAIAVNSLFESELERQFIAAFGLANSKELPVSIDKQLVNNKEGYVLRVGDCLWEIEPQVDLTSADGVAQPSRADFIFRPRRGTHKDKHKPIAVFTDGFAFHRSRVMDDTVQRAAIAETGRFRVWTLTWKDVRSVAYPRGEYAVDTLTPETMPSPSVYIPTVKAAGAEDFSPKDLSPFELFLAYLGNPDAEAVFQAHARAYSMALVQPHDTTNETAFNNWLTTMGPITEMIDEPFVFGKTMFGKWQPPGAHDFLSMYVGISTNRGQSPADRTAVVACIFDDEMDEYGPDYEKAWQGFWHFNNMMQFMPGFMGATRKGLNQVAYPFLSSPRIQVRTPDAPTDVDKAWQAIIEELFDQEAIIWAERMQQAGLPAPSVVGYELIGDDGEVIGQAEFVWEEENVAGLLLLQKSIKSDFESQGWTVFIEDDIPTLDKLDKEA